MGKRHDTIGIKQVVRPEWYDYALEMLLSGLPSKEIRAKLDEFISERLQSGGYGKRGQQTYTKAVTQIMRCWVQPDPEISELRDNALFYAHKSMNKNRIALHWIMTIAAYPFWHKVAVQVGRLLNLQGIITQNQIRQRCFEAMGERSTVERSARRVIRSFVEWGVLKDSETKGCYEKVLPITITDQDLTAWLMEAALHATPEGKAPINLLLNNPAFFAFQIPAVTGDGITRFNPRLEFVRYGLDDEMLRLK